MQYTTLGRTGLKVSVAGLGCGGGSRLGLAKGEEHAAGIVRRALDLGINFIDTAKFYGTEAAVGKAIRGRARDSVVISTKHKVVHNDGKPISTAEILAGLDASLVALGTDHVDLFCLHTVLPAQYDHVIREVVPALLREREKGKFRFLGITEFAGRDPAHDALCRALEDDCWDAMMIAFHMLNQNARRLLFPHTQAKNIGTLIMFAVRALFSVPGRLQQDMRELAAAGRVPAQLAEKDNPLDFLLHDRGARDIIEAAYRYARHEPGANVVLFGTGNPDHIEPNVRAILQPPLPEADRKKIIELFGALEGVGLDEVNVKIPAPGHKKGNLMKLYGSPGSPFARKVRIVLAEKNIPHEYIVARGSAPGSPVPPFNPLGKIPTLVLDDGRGLYDSPVIVEYLDAFGSGDPLIPQDFAERIEVKRWEALGDGIAEATVNINHEYREPKDKQRSAEWFEKQQAKIDRGLAVMEQYLGSGDFCHGKRFTLADIAAGYALDYLDFALPDYEWRSKHPALARLAQRLQARASFNTTGHARAK